MTNAAPRWRPASTLRQFLAADEELDHLVREVTLPAP